MDPSVSTVLAAKMALKAVIQIFEPLEPKFCSFEFLLMCEKLIVSPGTLKSQLVLHLEASKKLSRSTAERFISEAIRAGHIIEKSGVSQKGMPCRMMYLAAIHHERILGIFGNLGEQPELFS